MNDIDDEVKLGCGRVCLSGRLLELSASRRYMHKAKLDSAQPWVCSHKRDKKK